MFRFVTILEVVVQVALTLCGFTLCVSHFVRGLDFLQKNSPCAIFPQFPHFVLNFYSIFSKKNFIDVRNICKEVLK